MIETKITWNEGSCTKQLPEDESGFYKEIGSLLPDMNVPNDLVVSCAFGDAYFRIGKRGTYIKDGAIKPSMYVTETRNTITGLTPSTYPDAYLTCINPESNNYKYYWLRPNAVGIGATYGRIGSERGETFGTKDLQNPYPNHMYWIRYYEKLSKGYIDQTHIYLTKNKVTEKKAVKIESDNVISATLYHQLMAYAKHMVDTHLQSSQITIEQVKASQKYLKAMGERKTVKGFNTQLMKLLSVCPRKTRYVSTLLAQSTLDFEDIIQREEDLIAAMEAVASGTPVTKTYSETFDDFNIEVYEATDQQKQQVLSNLNASLAQKVKNIYRVIPQKQQKAFNSYLKENKIKKVKQLWHGSRNENWFSILTNSLQLNPNAQITGKMFGQGIYFAPSSMKSWGYTSYHGTRWANGRSDRAFMGLYAVAYGKAHNVLCSEPFTQQKLKSLGADCVHAHAGAYLLNDEIVFYDESAMVLNYLVEFA